ncbi:ShlB/FhaC/HecB family hemolysin secretion/activation protein [Leptotrichia sp. oral taxon 223]|uniref:ShlB/FhaC/HecB family hemolysin secretion/activation protein n=1 Tax=Leptotrichia sp. oral taxon 223 TaxID=712363 RepID=UPI0015BCDC27|nr:ShlB/FhaC/HecB family hemolysin secretion/activation protein [Leptotrichia sp. oral taxon 223]NWO19890.1 ShlB/FhaC/HecB family hemolysin secretion/activation protein [Leptotrichia sp. oral taxon 223]
MKKIVSCCVFLLANLAFPAPVNEANRIIDIQQRQIEQERTRQQQEKMQKEFENTKFDSPKPQVDKNIESNNLNTNKFLIKSVNIKDNDRLLSQREKNKIIGKYVYLELSSDDIKNLLTDLTNKLISKGYTTSVVNFDRNNDLTTGTLNLEIVAGRIEDIRINSGNGLDKYKEFFMFSKNKGKIFNIRDIDTATDNFNSINANNMTMEVLPGRKENYSRIEVKNTLKNKYTVGILTNNYGDSKQNGIWRRGINLNIDSSLGIGDNFYFTYMTVPKKDPDRSWKKTIEELKPGEILPIGPVGYDPANGDTLPYKRRLDMFNFGYTMKFRTYTLKLNSSKSIQESSFYTANTVYDMYSSNHILSADLEKILFRNQKSKIGLDLGIRRRHNQSYLEKSVLSDRKLTVGTVSLNTTTSLFGGIFGSSIGYERGLKIFNAERDNGKIDTTPKAQFHKYNVNLSYYKPVTNKFIYRANVYGSYSNDVLYGSERQTIGGVGSVGGYNTRESIQGDKAIEISNELAYNIPVKKFAVVSPYVNYGYGAAKYNRDKSKYRTGYVTGMTAGIRFDTKMFDFDFGYAKPMAHSEYLSPKKQEIYFSGSLKVSF